LVDNGSTIRYQGFGRLEIHYGPQCILWGRGVTTAAGPFSGPDDRFEATVADDGTVAIEAQAITQGQSEAGGCHLPGGSGTGEHGGLGWPDCVGRKAKTVRGAPARPGGTDGPARVQPKPKDSPRRFRRRGSA
jgi:hypothetical protein